MNHAFFLPSLSSRVPANQSNLSYSLHSVFSSPLSVNSVANVGPAIQRPIINRANFVSAAPKTGTTALSNSRKNSMLSSLLNFLSGHSRSSDLVDLSESLSQYISKTDQESIPAFFDEPPSDSASKHIRLREELGVNLGGRIWDCGLLFFEFLLSSLLKRDPYYFHNKRIVEVGSGTGVVGLWLWAYVHTLNAEDQFKSLAQMTRAHKDLPNLSATSFLLTDQTEAMLNLKHNLNENVIQYLGSSDSDLRKWKHLSENFAQGKTINMSDLHQIRSKPYQLVLEESSCLSKIFFPSLTFPSLGNQKMPKKSDDFDYDKYNSEVFSSYSALHLPQNADNTTSNSNLRLQRVDLSCSTLNWGNLLDYSHLSMQPGPSGFDLILASDVVFNPIYFDQLLDTWEYCSAGSHTTKILLAYRARAVDASQDRIFFDKAATQYGWRFHQIGRLEDVIMLFGDRDASYKTVNEAPKLVDAPESRSIVELDDFHQLDLDQGFKLGIEAAISRAIEEGEKEGAVRGAGVAQELGFYIGFIEIVQQFQKSAGDPDTRIPPQLRDLLLSPKIMKKIDKISSIWNESALSKLSKDPSTRLTYADIDVENDLILHLRNRFKSILSLLKLKKHFDIEQATQEDDFD